MSEPNGNGLDLYNKHRPTKWNELVGQDDAVKKLRAFGDSPPHALMFIGHSGCGKTTAARILMAKLGCHPKMDYMEVNAADDRGIDAMREIVRAANMRPFGKARLFNIDEAHQLTAAAQNMILKVLEDSPETSYFILCSTNPTKLIKTIETRCTVVKFNQMDQAYLTVAVKRIIKKEGLDVDDETVERIADAADGSARKAVVLLQQIMGLPVGERAEAVQKAEVRSMAIDLARKVADPRTKWPDVAKVLKTLDEDAEGVRRMMMAYLSAVLLGRGDQRTAWCMNCLRDPFFDGATGKAQLVLGCYEAVQGPS